MRCSFFLAAAVLLPPMVPAHVQAQNPGASASDPLRTEGPLRLEEFLAQVAARNPRLNAAKASAAAAATRVDEASTLPDPMLQLGVMNFGIPDFNTDMANSMAPAVQLMQMVPFPGKLDLKGRMAEAARDMANAGADETWWEVREQATGLFYDLYSLDRRIDVMRSTLELLKDFQTIARTMYAAGTGRQADVLRADVEVARMDGEIRKMEAMRTATAARLNGILDRPAAAPVASPALGRLPSTLPLGDTLTAWARKSRPLLIRARLGVERAEVGVKLAGKEIWPDLTFGLTYGQRDMGTATERMGSAMVGLSLPVHAASRQLAARDEADAMRGMAEAELRGLEAEVEARIGVFLAELSQSKSLIGLYRDEVIPEAGAAVESALASYRVGAVDFMTLVDAQMTVNRYEGELYQLLADYGKAAAGLESAVGRTLPMTDEILAEDPEER